VDTLENSLAFANKKHTRFTSLIILTTDLDWQFRSVTYITIEETRVDVTELTFEGMRRHIVSVCLLAG